MADRFVNTASPAGGNGTTNGTGGGDANRAWSTLLEALNGLGASLSTPIDLYCTGSAADTSNVDQGPWDFTTTATNKLRIIGERSPLHFNFVAPSAGDVYSTSLYRMEVTNRNGIYNNLPSHVWLHGVQVQVTVNDSETYIGIKLPNANQTATDGDQGCAHCVVRGVQTAGVVTGIEARPMDAGGGGTFNAYNCFIYDCSQGFTSDFITAKIYNCTTWDCLFGGYVENDVDAMMVRNCIAAGTADQYFNGTFHSDSNNNASPDGGPGANSETGTVSFVNTGANDFHLNSGDTVAKNQGMTDPASGLFSDDFDGTARSPTWDIGADEEGGGAAAASFIPVLKQNYRNMGYY